MDLQNVSDSHRFSHGKRKLSEKQYIPKRKRHKIHKFSKKKFNRRPRYHRARHRPTIHAKPEAPFNSTQFIMEEHDRLNDNDLDTIKPKRKRDSSFSMESDDLDDGPCAYSSSEEDEYMTEQTKEFWSAFDDCHAERLDSMSKTQLIQEHFLLEDLLAKLQRDLEDTRQRDRTRTRSPSPVDDEEAEESVPGEIRVDAETAAKIEIFTSEIKKLEEENTRLKTQNKNFKVKCKRCDSSSSDDTVDSSTDSSSSDSTTDSEAENSDPVTTSLPQMLEIEKCGENSADCASDSGIASCEGGASGLEDGCKIGQENGFEDRKSNEISVNVQHFISTTDTASFANKEKDESTQSGSLNSLQFGDISKCEGDQLSCEATKPICEDIKTLCEEDELINISEEKNIIDTKSNNVYNSINTSTINEVTTKSEENNLSLQTLCTDDDEKT